MSDGQSGDIKLLVSEGKSSGNSSDQLSALHAKCINTFQLWDSDKAGLTLSQIYLIQNMHVTDESQATLLEDMAVVFEACDSNHDGLLTLEEYRKFLVQLEAHRAQTISVTQVENLARFGVLFLVFLPFVFFFVHPKRGKADGSRARYVFNSFMQQIGIPFRVRQAILTRWSAFFLCWFILLLIWTLVALDFIFMCAHVRFSRPGHVSRVEASVPFGLGVGLMVSLGLMFSIIDKPGSSLRLADDSSEDAAAVNLSKLTVIAPSVTGADSSQTGSSSKATAEEVMATLFHQTAAQKRATSKSEKWRWIGSLIAGIILAILPFAVRIYRKFPFFGECYLDDPDRRCDDQINRELRFQTICSLVMNIVLGVWVVYLLTGTSFAYQERLRLMRRLGAMVDKDRAKKAQVTYLSFQHPSNIVVWSRMRDLVLALRAGEMRKMNIVVAGFVLAAAVLLGSVVYLIAGGLRVDIHASVLYVVSGYCILVISCYLAYPTIYTALLVNQIQVSLISYLAEEKWRLCVLGRLETVGEKRENLKNAFALTDVLQNHLVQSDTMFKILGVTITPGLFVSLLTAVGASVASWVASLF